MPTSPHLVENMLGRNVRQKTGGPEMQVISIRTEKEREYFTCRWFDKIERVQSAEFSDFEVIDVITTSNEWTKFVVLIQVGKKKLMESKDENERLGIMSGIQRVVKNMLALCPFWGSGIIGYERDCLEVYHNIGGGGPMMMPFIIGRPPEEKEDWQSDDDQE